MSARKQSVNAVFRASFDFEESQELAPKRSHRDSEEMTMVEKQAARPEDRITVQTSAISLASSLSTTSSAFGPLPPQYVVSPRSASSTVVKSAGRIQVSDSVFSVESKGTSGFLSQRSSQRSYRVSGLMDGGFINSEGKLQKAERHGTIPVRTALFFTFIVLSVILCGLIIFLSWTNATKANDEANSVCETTTTELVTFLHFQILTSVNQLVESYMSTPVLMNTIDELAVYRGVISTTRMDTNIEYGWDESKAFPNASFLNIVHGPTGSFMGLEMGEETYILWLRQNNTICTYCKNNGSPLNDSDVYLFAYNRPQTVVDAYNFSQGILSDMFDYDPRQRPWYQQIRQMPTDERGNGIMKWTDVYSFISSGLVPFKLSVLLGRCLKLTEECEVMVGVDMVLQGINDFVSTLRPTPNTRVLIVEANGLLIAASDTPVAVLDENGEVKRMNYTDINDTISTVVISTVLQGFGSFAAVQGKGTLQSVNDTTTSYQLFADNYGLHWVLLVGVVNDDFLRESRLKHEELIHSQTQMTLALLTYSLLILALGIVLFQIITGQITSPLKKLNRELAKVAEFKFHESVESKTSITTAWNTRLRELASIGNSFEIMRHNMQCFSRYIPPSVVTMIVEGHLNASLGVEPRNVTVFFSDLLNFTTIAESLPPRILMEVLGTYLDQMSRIIMENEGTVGEFVGDGILAFWNSPYDVANPQGRACQASLMMQQVLAEARAIQNEARQMTGEGGGRPLLRARMGLTAGRVLHGNIGTPDRMKFGIVGDSVNTASRLEALCGFYGVGILVPQQIEKEVRKDYLMRHVDRVIVKGKKRTTDLFELISTHEYSNDEGKKYVELFHEIMDMYWSRKFDQALTHIEEYQKQFPDDVASGIIAQRCEYYLKHPPSRTWNGVYVHMEKEGGGWLEAEGEEKDDPAPTLKAHSPQALVSPTLNMEQQQGKEPLELTETAISDITAAKFPVATPPAQRKDESPELSDPTPVKNHRNLSYLDIE